MRIRVRCQDEYGGLSKNMLDWTEQAEFCYRRGCRCEGCYMRDMLESGCYIKHTVLQIVKLHGEPPVKEEINKNVLYELLLKGLNLKEIAKEMGYNYNTFLVHTQALGIKGNLLRNKNKRSEDYRRYLYEKYLEEKAENEKKSNGNGTEGL